MLHALQVMTHVNRFPSHFIVSSDRMDPRTFLWTTGSRRPLSAALLVEATRGSSTYRKRSGSVAQLLGQEVAELWDVPVRGNDPFHAPAQQVAHAAPLLQGPAGLKPDPVYLPEPFQDDPGLGAAGVSFLDVPDLVEDVRPAPLYPVFPVRYQARRTRFSPTTNFRAPP